MLQNLHLKDVGPTRELQFAFAPRLNLLTGDNGLGKTFVLDAVWHALTLTWAGIPALPHPDAKLDTDNAPPDSEIFLTSSIEVRLTDGIETRLLYTTIHPQTQLWKLKRVGGPVAIPASARRVEDWMLLMDCITLYARVDGGFAVWDAYRHKESSSAMVFNREQVWDGLQEGERWLCNGLLRDWVSWQQTGNEPSRQMRSALEVLSGDGPEHMEPGPPQRVRIDDARDIPTLKLPYALVPITHASAGMRRICAMAYMLVWAWSEHQIAAKLQRRAPVKDLIFILDEVEAHLHPAWQRLILPALLKVVQMIAPEVRVQIFAATHSPLVLSSLEPLFDRQQDSLFTFDLHPDTHQVTAERAIWRPRGDVSKWLTSDIFDLKSARSKEAEDAIEHAKEALKDPDLPLVEVREIHRALQKTLGDTDPFWARWMDLAERMGIDP